MQILPLPPAESEDLTTAQEKTVCLQLVDQYNRCLRYINRKSFTTLAIERLMIEAKLVLLRQGINQEPTEPAESEEFTIEAERHYYTLLLEWLDQRIVLCAMKDRCITEDQKMVFEANLQLFRDTAPIMDPDYVVPVLSGPSLFVTQGIAQEHNNPSLIASPHNDVIQEPVVIPEPEQTPEP